MAEGFNLEEINKSFNALAEGIDAIKTQNALNIGDTSRVLNNLGVKLDELANSLEPSEDNTKDLLDIVEKLNNKKVNFVSLKENIDTTTPQGKFILTIFGALAELERESILQRQKEGIEIAKAEGKYKGRKRIDLDQKSFEKAVDDWKAGGRTATSIFKEFGISSQTFYRRVKEIEERNNPKKL